ncbi:hypothetical protein LJC34_00255 [Oscillospiraceae bacterium OttesenSCG-928-G22]|nr:hypothetical protein [Oscillospiraceae bacterium OttesenSCG-928-G22]
MSVLRDGLTQGQARCALRALLFNGKEVPLLRGRIVLQVHPPISSRAGIYKRGVVVIVAVLVLFAAIVDARSNRRYYRLTTGLYPELQGLPFTEIAFMLNRPCPTVKGMYQRAPEKMKKYLCF